MLVAAGADKSLENDEPLVFSSSSSEDEDKEDGPIRAHVRAPEAESPTSKPPSSESERANPRKRSATGHTPFDLAKCRKVRKLLESKQSPKPSQHTIKTSKPASREGESQPLNDETLSALCEILSLGDVPWKQLAEKLGMLTLADLYQEGPSPCRNLLQNYQLSGGPVEGLVDALQSLGLTEGVRLLRHAELRAEKQNPELTVDSGFGSQPIDQDMEEPALANQ